MFERFSRPAREVVAHARQQAQDLGHRHLGTEHLLLGMMSLPNGANDALVAAGLTREQVAKAVSETTVLGSADADALRTVGIDLNAVLARITDTFGDEALRRAKPARRGRVGVTPRVKKVLGLALREAIHLGHSSIDAEHVLLGILRDGDGRAAKIITAAGLSPDDLRRGIVTGMGKAA